MTHIETNLFSSDTLFSHIIWLTKPNKCWEHDKDKRPSFADIEIFLNSHYNKLASGNYKNWFQPAQNFDSNAWQIFIVGKVRKIIVILNSNKPASLKDCKMPVANDETEFVNDYVNERNRSISIVFKLISVSNSLNEKISIWKIFSKRIWLIW